MFEFPNIILKVTDEYQNFRRGVQTLGRVSELLAGCPKLGHATLTKPVQIERGVPGREEGGQPQGEEEAEGRGGGGVCRLRQVQSHCFPIEKAGRQDSL